MRMRQMLLSTCLPMILMACSEPGGSNGGDGDKPAGTDTPAAEGQANTEVNEANQQAGATGGDNVVPLDGPVVLTISGAINGTREFQKGTTVRQALAEIAGPAVNLNSFEYRDEQGETVGLQRQLRESLKIDTNAKGAEPKEVKVTAVRKAGGA